MSWPFLHARVRHSEENGSVTVFEEGGLPFGVRRCFLVEARPGQVRGDHAHRECWQALFTISGLVVVDTIFAEGNLSFSLEPGGEGLVLPPMVWATQHYMGVEPSLLVMCSTMFDEADYIRDIDEFQAEISR